MNTKDDDEDIYFCSQEPEEETDKHNTKTTLEESSIITDREINDILWQESNITKHTIEELPDVIYGNQEQINDITWQTITEVDRGKTQKTQRYPII